MKSVHAPHLHLAHRFIGALGEGVFSGLLHHEQWHEPPARTVPAAADWPEWHWYEGDIR
jgi:hypothetical protein